MRGGRRVVRGLPWARARTQPAEFDSPRPRPKTFDSPSSFRKQQNILQDRSIWSRQGLFWSYSTGFTATAVSFYRFFEEALALCRSSLNRLVNDVARKKSRRGHRRRAVVVAASHVGGRKAYHGHPIDITPEDTDHPPHTHAPRERCFFSPFESISVPSPPSHLGTQSPLRLRQFRPAGCSRLQLARRFRRWGALCFSAPLSDRDRRVSREVVEVAQPPRPSKPHEQT